MPYYADGNGVVHFSPEGVELDGDYQEIPDPPADNVRENVQFLWDEDQEEFCRAPEIVLRANEENPVKIPADGESSRTITIEQRIPDQGGNLVGGDSKIDVNAGTTVSISASRGQLSDLTVDLNEGKGEFEITSIQETVQSHLTAEPDSPTVRTGALDIQFISP